MKRERLEYIIDPPTSVQEEKNSTTIVFLHGSPDDASVWIPTCQYLCQKGYRVVRILLPGFEQTQSCTLPISFEEVVERLRNTLLHTQSWGSILVGHDWGAIFLYMLLHKHPEAAQKFVALEVGAAPRSLCTLFFVLFYHSLLNVAYGIGGVFGDTMMRLFCLFLPRPKNDNALQARSQHAWLYRQAWKEGAKYGPWWWYFRTIISLWRPSPQVPFLSLFGTDTHSWLRFHEPKWRKEICSSNNRSRSVGIPGRHWFFLENPKRFSNVLEEFIAEPRT